MLSPVTQCEFSMSKTLLAYDMSLREIENCEKNYKEIECSVAGAHEKLLSAKSRFFKQNECEKNHLEYDALANVIQHHPDS